MSLLMMMTAFVITCLSFCRSKVERDTIKIGRKQEFIIWIVCWPPFKFMMYLEKDLKNKEAGNITWRLWKKWSFHLLGMKWSTNWWRHAILFFHFLSLAKSFLHRLHFTTWTTQQIFLSRNIFRKKENHLLPPEFFFIQILEEITKRMKKQSRMKATQSEKRSTQRLQCLMTIAMDHSSCRQLDFFLWGITWSRREENELR